MALSNAGAFNAALSPLSTAWNFVSTTKENLSFHKQRTLLEKKFSKLWTSLENGRSRKSRPKLGNTLLPRKLHPVASWNSVRSCPRLYLDDSQNVLKMSCYGRWIVLVATSFLKHDHNYVIANMALPL
jgi:hypothetical protein